MNDENIELLTEEEKNLEIKRKSRHRIFIALLIVDIGLAAYIIYALIFFFTHLS